jgi:8-oxo-dGTP pyrophosphatase MutT (NUDIX family)
VSAPAGVAAPDTDRVSEPPEVRTTGSRLVYANRWLRLREDAIVRGDGASGLYSVVEKRDFAIVIPLHEDRTMTLVEQYRYPIGMRRMEFPQGSSHRPLGGAELAAAELAEETGLRARELRMLGRLHHAPGYSTQGCLVFAATGLTQGEQRLDPEEHGLTVHRISRAEFERRVRRGEITDCASIAAYGLLHLAEPR